jgi:tetratricopeptide (TPR) repeat protein
MKNAWKSLGAVCVLVIGVYAYTAHSGFVVSSSLNAADSYYNSLVQGFRAGQLSLKKEVPPGLAQLANPYDPTASEPYQFGPTRLHDLSYYKGRLYLYFGVTPALILFWPFVALTGHYLSDRLAVLMFCTIGFLASVGVLYAAWRRYFSEVSVWVVTTGALALGLATVVPVMLPRSDVYEVAISCGYMLTMLALGAIWGVLHKPERRCWWLAAASVAYGLAVGARSSLLFGAVILLVPVAQAWRERRKIWALLIAAIGPITLIGVGLMLYNYLRFGSALEFGLHYELNFQRQLTQQFFSLHYLWFNLRVYFLEPVRWTSRFPFVQGIVVPPLPAGHCAVDDAFGVMTNTPLIWAALAVPLAWRNRSGQGTSILRWYVAVVALLVGACATTLGSFFAANMRYEVDFLPALVLLACIGILALERALAPTPESGLADRSIRRRVARWGWGALLSFSVAFNLLVSVGRCVDLYAGGYHNAAVSMWRLGKIPEALELFQQALRIKPDFVEAHYNLGIALAQTGKNQEAIAHYEQALRINPDYAEAHNNLGNALGETGKIEEAIAHYKQALRIKPDFAEAHYDLGMALVQTGKNEEAIAHFEQALRIKPDYAEAHSNLGVSLAQTGKIKEAIAHFEQALRIKPDFAGGHYNLGIALAQTGRTEEAIAHFEQALRIEPDNAEAHCNLGTALEKLGRTQEAIKHYQQALKLRPDLTAASNALARLQARQ